MNSFGIHSMCGIIICVCLCVCRLWMHFANLFSNDRLLGDTTNEFLNESWADILNELKPVLKKAIGEIVQGVVGPIFAKFPYEQLFLAD